VAEITLKATQCHPSNWHASIIYDFLLVFHSNYLSHSVSFLRYSLTMVENSNFSNPHEFNAPGECVPQNFTSMLVLENPFYTISGVNPLY